MRSLRRLPLLLLLACSPAAPALAQPTSAAPAPNRPAPAKNAEQLYREGMDFVAKQKWAEAEARFREAFAMSPTYDTAANLGHTQQKLGKIREAAEHLSFALRHWPVAGKREPRELTEKTLGELRPQLGTLAIEVSVPGALVVVSGREVGRAPIAYEVFVDPGAVTVEAKLDGYQVAQQAITAEKGKRYEVKLAMQKEAAPVPSVTATASAAPTSGASAPQAAPRPSLPIVLAGAGATLVLSGIGVGLMVVAGDRGSAADAKLAEIRAGAGPCTKPPATPDCETLLQLRKDHDAFFNAGVGLFVGAGIAALGTVTYVLWPRRPAVTVAPVAGKDIAGFIAQGSF